jgi:hypothetical protein
MSDSLPDYVNTYNTSNNNNLETINITYSPKIFKSLKGYDLRYNNINESEPSIYIISRYFRILEILNLIENNSISVNEKIDIIKQYNDDSITKYIPNINIDNLLNDW